MRDPAYEDENGSFVRFAQERHQGRALVMFRQAGNLLFASGLGSGDFCQGRVGADVTLEEGYQACRYIALRQLDALKCHLGGFERVEQVLRVFGLVCTDEGFTALDRVFDGFSDTLMEVLGQRAVCPRLIMGTNNLPVGNTTAEIEVLYKLVD